LGKIANALGKYAQERQTAGFGLLILKGVEPILGLVGKYVKI